VLRVLGNVLSIAGFDYDSSEQVRDEVVTPQSVFASGLDNAIDAVSISLGEAAGGGQSGSQPDLQPLLQRIAEVPIYFADPLVRRADALQRTHDAAAPTARLCAATLAQFGIADGSAVRVRQGQGEALLNARADESVPAGCVRVAAAHASTAALGDMFGAINVERA